MKLFLFLPAILLPAFAATAVLAQPQVPATFWGSASVDGERVPDGTEIRGYIDGKDCTQLGPGYSGTVTDGDVSAYAIMVMHETQEPGCGREGKTVTFTIGGRKAEQTAIWEIGVQRLDLNAGEGSPVPLPTPTPTAAGNAAAPPTIATEAPSNPTTQPGQGAAPPLRTGTPPIDPIQMPGGSTPLPPNSTEGTLSAQAKDDGDGDGSLWLVIGGVVLVLIAAGGAGGYWLSSRKRTKTPPAA